LGPICGNWYIPRQHRGGRDAPRGCAHVPNRFRLGAPGSIFSPELSRIVAAAGGRVTTFRGRLRRDRNCGAARRIRAAGPRLCVTRNTGRAWHTSPGQRPRVKPIVLTSQRDFRPLARYREAGAIVLPKALSCTELTHALRAIFQGDAYPITHETPRRLKTVWDEYVAIGPSAFDVRSLGHASLQRNVAVLAGAGGRRACWQCVRARVTPRGASGKPRSRRRRSRG